MSCRICQSCAQFKEEGTNHEFCGKACQRINGQFSDTLLIPGKINKDVLKRLLLEIDDIPDRTHFFDTLVQDANRIQKMYLREIAFKTIIPIENTAYIISACFASRFHGIIQLMLLDFNTTDEFHHFIEHTVLVKHRMFVLNAFLSLSEDKVHVIRYYRMNRHLFLIPYLQDPTVAELGSIIVGDAYLLAKVQWEGRYESAIIFKFKNAWRHGSIRILDDLMKQFGSKFTKVQMQFAIRERLKQQSMVSRVTSYMIQQALPFMPYVSSVTVTAELAKLRLITRNRDINPMNGLIRLSLFCLLCDASVNFKVDATKDGFEITGP